MDKESILLLNQHKARTDSAQANKLHFGIYRPTKKCNKKIVMTAMQAKPRGKSLTYYHEVAFISLKQTPGSLKSVLVTLKLNGSYNGFAFL